MRFILVFSLLFLIACTDQNKTEIIHLLEQRDASISQKNIEAYTALLSTAYLQDSGNKAIQNMQHIFATFEQVNITSRDRHIQTLDDNRAICEQTYILKVLADGKWRNMVQREQVQLQREHGTWKINGGL